MSTPLCEAKEISKSFNLPHGQSLLVIDKMNLQLFPGEIVALIGPSGCGKSTFLRILAGLIPANSGTIFYHNQKQEGLLPHSAMVFQNFALYPWMNVKENVEVVLQAIGVESKDRKTRTEEAIGLIGLSGCEEAYPRELSGGMKQRVGLARALVTDPEILLMDEPFSSVDALTAEGLRTEFLHIFAEKKNRLSSILLVSHDVREVSLMADRIYIMQANPGKMYTLLENTVPKPREVHSFELMNLIDRLYESYHYQEKPKPSLEKEPLAPLLAAGPGQIYGLLLRLLAYSNGEDVYKLAQASFLNFDTFVLVLQGAELLDFVEVIHRKVLLTDAGKSFVRASAMQRREIWRKQLLKMSVFQEVLQKLKQSDKGLHRNELLHFFHNKLPHQNASFQFNCLVKWAEYGNLFRYHKKTRTLHPYNSEVLK